MTKLLLNRCMWCLCKDFFKDCVCKLCVNSLQANFYRISIHKGKPRQYQQILYNSVLTLSVPFHKFLNLKFFLPHLQIDIIFSQLNNNQNFPNCPKTSFIYVLSWSLYFYSNNKASSGAQVKKCDSDQFKSFQSPA